MQRLAPTALRLIALMTLAVAAAAAAAPPPEQTVRAVFGQVRAAADTDQDGTLTVAECKAMFRDPAVAEKNCRFWDADKDGNITEDEYVQRVGSVTSRSR